MEHLRPAFVLLLGLTLLTGVAYPALITAVAQVAFPWQANGSMIERNHQRIGSALIGQNFTRPGYFHGRPSATTGTNAKGETVADPYNANNSGGSNLGPTAQALRERVAGDVKTLAAENPGTPIPEDLVTTSGSGLDPDISPAAAYFQVPRVAAARHLTPEALKTLIAAHVRGRTLGVFGSPHVNVLDLNLALDRLQAGGT